MHGVLRVSQENKRVAAAGDRDWTDSRGQQETVTSAVLPRTFRLGSLINRHVDALLAKCRLVIWVAGKLLWRMHKLSPGRPGPHRMLEG